MNSGKNHYFQNLIFNTLLEECMKGGHKLSLKEIHNEILLLNNYYLVFAIMGFVICWLQNISLSDDMIRQLFLRLHMPNVENALQILRDGFPLS